MNIFKRCDCIDPKKCKHAWWYKFHHEFQRYERSTKTANRQQAERIAARRRGHVLDGDDEEIVAVSSSLSQLIKDYTKAIEKEHRTCDKTARTLRIFSDSIGDCSLRAISPFMIEKYKIARTKDVSRSTVNRELTILRGLFSRAVAWKRLTTSPISTVRDYDVDDVRVRVLSDTELATLQQLPEFEYLLCRSTLESLARISELLTLRTSHLGPNWMERRVKGGSVIRVPITDALRARLLAQAGCSCQDDCLIFGNITQQAASNRVIRALRALGIKNASHHTMRHTGVTLMLDAGRNPRVIQSLAGWTSLRMLERYGHTRDTETRKAVEGVAAYLDALDPADDSLRKQSHGT